MHVKGEAAFVAEAGNRAHVWWNQSGNSVAAKIEVIWFEEAAMKHNERARVAPQIFFLN